MEKNLPASEARQDFAELINRANFAAERTVITKNGKNVAVILGYADYQHLVQLEDNADLTLTKGELADKNKAKKSSRRKSGRADSEFGPGP